VGLTIGATGSAVGHGTPCPDSERADVARASPMAGAGAYLGVGTDYDGHTRPSRSGTMPDIGAFEVTQRRGYLPLVMRN
jgi:hypothetical protein